MVCGGRVCRCVGVACVCSVCACGRCECTSRSSVAQVEGVVVLLGFVLAPAGRAPGIIVRDQVLCQFLASGFPDSAHLNWKSLVHRLVLMNGVWCSSRAQQAFLVAGEFFPSFPFLCGCML